MATLKSGLNSGAGFNSSDTITSTTLNNHVNDGGIVAGTILTADMADSSSKITGVTFAKMQHIDAEKVLARTTAGEGDIEEIDIAGASGILLDEDTMSSDSATRGATQQSIKAYIDAEIDKTLGHNQTWQTVTRARDNTTSYTNDTGKPIITRLLAIKQNVGTGGNDDISIDIAITPSGGSETYIRLIDSVGDNGYGSDIGQIVVPVGASYKFRDNSPVGLTTAVHHELR